MNRYEILNMLVGFALVVGGIFGMVYCIRAADRITARYPNRSREEIMQEVWDDLTEMAFYQNASADDQIRFYDAFWKTPKKD